MTEIPSWSSVCQWMTKNPHTKTLPVLRAAAAAVQTIRDANGWEVIPVEPATPLAAITMVQNTEFQAMSVNSRKIDLTESLNELQNRAVSQLKGRQWPVRKTAEGIVAMGTEDTKTWSTLGWEAICNLCEAQIVILNEETKTIQF